MTTYCTIPDVNALFGDISDDISTDMFNVSIDNAGSWIDSALLRNHIPIPEVSIEDNVNDGGDVVDEPSEIIEEPIENTDSDEDIGEDTSEVIESTTTDTTNIILVNVPSILKTASIYFAASDILMSLYHGDQYESLMDYWFNKATSLLDGYIEAYKAENNIDSNVGHRNALTYNERRVNRGYGDRCYY